VIRQLLERNPIDKEIIDDVIFGCANQAGEDNRNVARMSLLLGGLPVTVPGVTVNRLCGSGLEAVNLSANTIKADGGEVYLAGGTESMTRAPLVMMKAESAYQRGNIQLHDTTLGWRLINDKMNVLYPAISLGETAENVAEQYGISREMQDEFALSSQEKYERALAAGNLLARSSLLKYKEEKGM
jgi:acetyl-CoA acetyltransferase